MTELIFAAIGLIAGAIIAYLGNGNTRTERDDALLALAREQRRNATNVTTIAQMQKREHIAVAQIVSLTYALSSATAQAQGAHGATLVGADVRERFSRN